jgi:isopentenyl-diphosphate delta-isomerase type 1
MENDLLDIVDDEDRPVGQASRKHIHEYGLKHRAVHVLIFNSKNQLFLQKRSKTKDTHPNKWDSSASGHVDTGEEYHFSAKREIIEELGVQIANLKPLFKIDACMETGNEFVWVYQSEYDGHFKLNENEIDSGAWQNLQAIDSWMRSKPEDFTPALLKIWTELKTRKIVKI